MTQLPFFVYGTLRQGFGNDRILDGIDVAFDKGASMLGAKMTTVGFPYVWLVQDQTYFVTGEIVRIDPANYEKAVRRLDALEGYFGPDRPNHYDRVITTVRDAAGRDVKVFTYLVDEQTASRGRPVESGDFADVARMRPLAHA